MDSGHELIGLSYCSVAAFSVPPKRLGIPAEVVSILTESRRNNGVREVSGLLHFADGRFFQYLEGPADHVDALYARICRDDRHREVRRLTRRPLPRRRFIGLPMKYVALERPIEQVLAHHGLDRFQPDRFTPALIEDLVAHAIPERESAPEADPDGPASRSGSLLSKLLGR